MENQTLKRILDAKEKFTDPEDSDFLGGLEEMVRKALVILSLKDNKGIQVIYNTFARDVEEIKELLLNADAKTLPDIQRDRILDKKNLYERFLKLFNDAENDLKTVDKSLDDKIPE